MRKYIPQKIRYIRDHVYGSTINTASHWVELEAIDYDGVNRALGRGISSSENRTSSLVTDGNTGSASYFGVSAPEGWVQVDLGEAYELKEIKVWHYYADGRTYHKSKTEVSVDGKSWHAVFDSRVDGEYPETAAGKTHTLDALGPSIEPTTNASTGLTMSGVAAEGSATNTWNGNFTVYNNYSVPSTMVKLNETYLGQPVWRIGMTVTDDKAQYLDHFRTTMYSHGVYGGYQTWTAETSYVSSIYWRPVNKHDMVFGGTASNIPGWTAGPNVKASDGWTRYYRYRTGVGRITQNDHIHHSFRCPSLQLNETIYFDVCCPQTEAGVVSPSSYVNGSRSTGQCVINSGIGLSDFTVIGEFTPNEDSDNLVDYSSYLNFGNGLILYSWQGKPFIDGNAITGNVNENVHKTVNIKKGVKCFYVVQRQGQTVKWRMMDELGTDTLWEKTHANIATNDIGDITLRTSWAGVHRNLSIYNRVLTEEEITKVVKGTFSVDVDGNTSTVVSEKKVLSDEAAAYFPFGTNVSDRMNRLAAVKNDNTLHEAGGAWVGKGTTNVVMHPDWSTGWSTGYLKNITWNEITGPPGVEGETVIGFENNDPAGTGFLYSYGDYAPQTPDTTYTVSVYVKVEGSPVNINAYTADNTETGRHSSNRVTVNPEDGWTRIVFDSFLNPADSQSNSLSFSWWGRTGRMWMCAPQMEAQAFATPFVKTVRPKSELVLPYEAIDCKRDFTITGWFYFRQVPVVGAFSPFLCRDRISSTYGGRRILIMNSSTSGASRTIRLWYGSGGVEASMTGPSSVDMQDNTWNFFCLRRSGDELTLFVGANGAIASTKDATGGTLLNNDEDPALWGWFVGRYSVTGQSDGYARDYQFLQKALSDAEVESIFKTQMRSIKGKTLQLQGQLKEGRVL